MATWIFVGKGIRYQEHATRKHGKKPDRYRCLQYRLRGQVINEGWVGGAPGPARPNARSCAVVKTSGELA